MEAPIEKFSLKYWWNIVGFLGVMLVIGSIYTEIEFVEEKYLFGLGIGMILISLSYIIAQKEYTTIKPPNAYTGPAAYITFQQTEHTSITKILLLLGITLFLYFGYRLIIQIL